MNRPYVTARNLLSLALTISARERQILISLSRVRLATSEQLERLYFQDVTTRQARKTLTGMVHRRLLQRLPRSVGGPHAGSGAYVYALDTAGVRLIAPGSRRRTPWSIGLPFLAHSLEVTGLYVQLVEADRAGTLKLIHFTAEPACWRSFSGPGGGRVTLKPDAYAVVQLGAYEDRWFIEVDRDTEATTAIRRKCEVYRRYWQTGTEQARSDIFPRVLWLVPDDRRKGTIIDVLGRLPEAAWPLFAVAQSRDAMARIAQGANV